MKCSMASLKEGETAVVQEIQLSKEKIRRLADIGLVRCTKVKCIGISPLGDPKAYNIKGAVIAIRKSDCENIIVIKEK